jgi:hypothetical protein
MKLRDEVVNSTISATRCPHPTQGVATEVHELPEDWFANTTIVGSARR